MSGFKLKKPAAILQGGPRDGWAYYVEDLEHMQRAAQRLGQRFDYVKTGEFEDHPGSSPATVSEVWRYRR